MNITVQCAVFSKHVQGTGQYCHLVLVPAGHGAASKQNQCQTLLDTRHCPWQMGLNKIMQVLAEKAGSQRQKESNRTTEFLARRCRAIIAG